MKRKQGTALITGGAKRIGRALCLALAEDGFNIALHYHTSRAEAQRVENEVRKKGGACSLFGCDLADDHQTQLLIKKVHQTFPDLNVLINNASSFTKSSLLESPIQDFDRNIALHLKAPLLLTREFARMAKEGVIINLLDTHVSDKHSSHFFYLLSKKALLALTEMAAAALAPRIRVNAVAPGLVLPPEGKTSDYLKRLAGRIPLRKTSSPTELTETVLFLIHQSSLTGQIIFHDSGEHLLTKGTSWEQSG